MPRTTSTTYRRAAFAQSTGECPLVLLTIDHADLETPIRVVHNGEDIVSRGNTFTATSFEFILPDDSEDKPPVSRLSICNVDRSIVNMIRSLTSTPTVLAEVVLASTPDVVEASFEDLEFKEVTYDPLIVEGALGYENYLMEPFPADKFTPAIFPGLF